MGRQSAIPCTHASAHLWGNSQLLNTVVHETTARRGNVQMRFCLFLLSTTLNTSDLKHDSTVWVLCWDTQALWSQLFFNAPAERSADGAGGAPSCRHAVHPGDGPELSAGSQRLLQAVLPQSQSELHDKILPTSTCVPTLGFHTAGCWDMRHNRSAVNLEGHKGK